MSFEIPEATGSLVVIAPGEDGVTEEVVWGNIDMAFVHQDVIIIFLVRETRLEGDGDVFQR